MSGMARVQDESDAASSDLLVRPLGDVNELPVQTPGDDQCWYSHGSQFGPHRLHRSRSKLAKSRRQPHRRVLQPVFLGPVVEVSEHRLREPFVKECSQSDLLDVICQLEIAPEPLGSCYWVFDARSARDQDKLADKFRMAYRSTKAEPGAHGISDVAPFPDGLNYLLRHFGERRNIKVRETVARKIHPDESRLLYPIHDRIPGSNGLGEAVNKSDSGARPHLIAMQHADKDCTS